MEQGNTQTERLEINNLEDVEENTEYIITSNITSNIIVREPQPIIENLENIQTNTRYQLTRNTNNNVEVVENTNVSIPNPNSDSILTYSIRRENENYSLTTIGSFNEFFFATNNATIGEEFDILGITGSRISYVFTASCKIIKFGLLHVSNFRRTGLINTTYSFEFIINNRNRTAFQLRLDNSVGTNRARVLDVEDLNNFVSSGDSMGLRFVSGNTGNYMECRITVDFNNRSLTALGGFQSETIQ